MKKRDIFIIGGGIWGLASAYLALKKGLRVTVIEANALGQNASSGIVGALSPHVPDKLE